MILKINRKIAIFKKFIIKLFLILQEVKTIFFILLFFFKVLNHLLLIIFKIFSVLFNFIKQLQLFYQN